MKTKVSAISFIKGESARPQAVLHAEQEDIRKASPRRKSHYAAQAVFSTLKVSDLPAAATEQKQKIYKKEL